MRLTKLELYGFKSFAKRTEICFDKGITVIVGPNGSGKSNIADSIRWVLGEQSAKTLRGARMEDVIFSGTESRKAMSYCEVTLTFDNTDGALPIDYAEVSITRRLYRSGDSEYCINKTQCRLKDLQELFRDTGLGKEGYSIVGQGRVEEILSNKSGERRKAFEEAAGIMKYRVRKEASERDLENTRKNLTRLQDIISEITERIDPLKEQAEKASQYLSLRDELRDLDINLFLHQYDKINERLISIKSTIEQITHELESSEEGRIALSEKCQNAEAEERASADELNALNNKLISMTAGLEEQIGNLKVLDERLANSDKEHELLLERIRENTARKSELEARLGDSNEQSDKREEILKQLRADYSEAEKAQNGINEAVTALESEIEELKNAMFEAQKKLSDARSSVSGLTATRESLEKRLEEMDTSCNDVSDEIEGLKGELESAQEELSKLEESSADIKSRLENKMSQQNGCIFDIREAENEIHKTEQLLESKKSRYAALMDMKKAHDGYYMSIQKLLSDAEQNRELSSRIEGTVAELIQVPQKYEVALEMAMGATLQNIVTPDEEAAKYVIGYLRQRRYGRATFLPVTVMRPRTLTPDERRRILSVRGCFGIASELISYSPRHKGIVENLLGRTVIVDNLDTGVAINKLVGQSLRIATTEGDIINPGGSMTGGSTGKSLNLLGKERECADLLSEMDGIKKTLTAMREKREELERLSSELSSAVSQLSKENHECDIKLATQRDKADIIAQQLDRELNKDEQQKLERSRILDNIADIDRSIEAAKNTQSELSEGSTTTQSDIVAKQTELAKLRTRQSNQQDVVTDLKVRIASLEKEADALSGEHDRLCKDIEKLNASIESDRKRELGFASEQAQLAEERTALSAQIEAKRSQNAELNSACKAVEEKRAQLLAKVDELRSQKDKADELADELKERIHRQEMAQSKSESELVAIQDRIWTEYELTYENALKYRREMPITQSTQRAVELKKQIRELGDININAIEEYRTLNERYTTLRTQFDDLKKAEGDLVTLIDELVRQMETSFREKFEKICENFKDVFTKLFGGGTAQLILSDSNDILNCDIDILAQIPGKKLQSLAPLSGGERALTAIALQFAILALKPTAFCLLDEIDASLDEVNVTRFADYVQVYANSTQFILITHRRGSMESCNAIYGVAQEEKGISKVVSARFSQPNG